MTKKTTVVVKQDETKPVPVEVLAESIKRMAEGVRKLRAGPLNDHALVLLIQHAAPTVDFRQLNRKEIKSVLDGIDNLERTYLRKA